MKLKKDDDTKLSKSHAIIVVLSLSLIILRELPHFGGILKYMLNIHITEIMRKKKFVSYCCHRVKILLQIENLTKLL